MFQKKGKQLVLLRADRQATQEEVQARYQTGSRGSSEQTLVLLQDVTESIRANEKISPKDFGGGPKYWSPVPGSCD